MAKLKGDEQATETVKKPCGDCNGTGRVPGDRYTDTFTCSTCDGTGVAPAPKNEPAVEGDSA